MGLKHFAFFHVFLKVFLDTHFSCFWRGSAFVGLDRRVQKSAYPLLACESNSTVSSSLEEEFGGKTGSRS